MSFLRSSLNRTSKRNPANAGGHIWTYTGGSDALDTILADSFFDSVSKILQTDDLIEINHLAGWTSVKVTVDRAVSGGTVTVSGGGGGVLNPITLYAGFDPLSASVALPETIFASGHGWTKQSSAGTQTDDTTDFIVGSQSLKLVDDGDGLVVFTRSGTLSPLLDMTSKNFVLKIKASDVSIITELQLFATSDAFASAFWTWKMESNGLTNYIVDGEWFVFTLSFGDRTLVTTGSPDRSAIDKLQFRIKTDATGTLSVNINLIGSQAEPSRGLLTLAFDDGWESQYNEAKKKMSEFSFPGITNIISSLIDDSAGLYMTKAQVRELQDVHGWDIGCHHQTNLSTLTLAEAEVAIKEEKTFHAENGFNRGADNFAIPNGAINSGLLKLFRKYFKTSRTIAETAETFPPADWNRLRIFNVLTATSTASIATAVDEARTNNYWLILLFHKIVTSPADNTEYSITNFGTVIDDIAADGIKVKTISEVTLDNEELSETQLLTGAGAVDILSLVTHVVTTGTDALTLVDGNPFQRKYVVMITDGGAGTLTPSNLANGTTIVFDDVGDSADLLFTGGSWVFMGGTATLA